MSPYLASIIQPNANLGSLPRCFLSFYEFQGASSSLLTIMIFSPAWHGLTRFAWEFIPGDNNNRSIIRIVLSRSSYVILPRVSDSLQRRDQESGFKLLPILEIHRVHNYGVIPGLGETINVSELYVQRTKLLAEFNRNAIVDQQLRSSNSDQNIQINWSDYLRLSSPNNPEIFNKETKTTIKKFTNAVAWELTIEDTILRPSGYAYQIERNPSTSSYDIAIVRTELVNVQLEITADPEFGIPQIHIWDEVVDNYRDVPEQGEWLDPLRLSDRSDQDISSHPNFTLNVIPSSNARRQITAFELMIGFVPVVGDIYDITQIIYTMVTGRTFWGENVSQEELALSMLAAFASLIPSIPNTSLSSLFSRSQSISGLRNALGSSEVTNSLLGKVSPEFIESINSNPILQRRIRELIETGSSSPSITRELVVIIEEINRIIQRLNTPIIQRQLNRKFHSMKRAERLDVLNESLEGIEPRNWDGLTSDWRLTTEEKRLATQKLSELNMGDIDVATFLNSIDDKLVASLVQTLEKRELSKIFNEDFSDFSHVILAQGYKRYKSKGGRGSAPRWARNQTRGQFRQILLLELGDKFSRKITRGLRNKLFPHVDAVAKTFYNNIWDNGNIIDLYRDLVKTRKGFGHLFEADHIIEKRFLRSPRVADNVPDEDDLFAILVPKDQRVARQLSWGMRINVDGNILRNAPIYDHKTKTKLFNMLIPHGSEDFFTLQQWHDAHVFVYHSLGVPESLYRPVLREQFIDLANSTGESFRVIHDVLPTPGEFLPENGWGTIATIGSTRAANRLQQRNSDEQ